jgi:plasmid stability protein
MATTITLPDALEAQLQQQADVQHRSLEAVALDLLHDALGATATEPDLDDIVARIRLVDPKPQNVRVATGSLADALRHIPSDVSFDLDRWTRAWEAVETEMRAMTRTDDLSEGRG